LDFTTFSREIENRIIYYVKGTQTLLIEKMKVDFIKPIKSQDEPKFKFITMDLETKEIEYLNGDTNKINKKMEPVCISIKTNDNLRTFAI